MLKWLKGMNPIKFNFLNPYLCASGVLKTGCGGAFVFFKNFSQNSYSFVFFTCFIRVTGGDWISFVLR